jgi:hypothetical protein
MKSLQQLCAACMLTLVLTLSVFAGDMSTTIVSPQQPPAPQSMAQGDVETSYAGNMETTSSSITATDSVAGLALSLVQNVLALV